MIDIEVRTADSDPTKVSQVLAQDLGFGRVFADKMFQMRYHVDRGWYDAEIVPYGKIALEPSAMVFHYGQEIFEGHKAYLWQDGRVAMFRPDANAERLNRSAHRMRMPQIPVDVQLNAVTTLVSKLRDWVPSASGATLYLRPTMIATEAGLGVRPSREYLYFVIASPVGPYFPTGFAPIKVLAEDKLIRAAAGGTGEAKTGGNYAASLYAYSDAMEQGYRAVMWLDAKEHRYVEEIGAMNVMFVIEGKIVTSPLVGSLLPGITRDSILHMAADYGFEVEERQIPIDEVIERIQDGSLTESFGAGTAAVITPINTVGWKGTDFVIGDGDVGPVARSLHQTLTDIQWGRAADPYGWIHFVP